jgi:ABC-2 type transport system ATP-binding protein
MNSANAIEIRDLRKRFPKFTLGPVNLTAPRGGIYGFVGPNGSGKSATLDLLFGMGEPDSGTLAAAGYDNTRDEVAMKLRATYFSPETSFASWGRVDRAIRFVSQYYPTWDHALCDRLLADFRLKATDAIAALSFGSKTKLGLLLAICPQTETLVLDEPTTGLDPESTQILFNALLKFVGEDERRGVLISSHQLKDLERYADHIGVLKAGRMLLEGNVRELLERHKLVEYEGAEPIAFTGFHPLRAPEGRHRAMVDTAVNPEAVLAAKGLVVKSAGPLTLEEIFLNLTTDRH